MGSIRYKYKSVRPKLKGRWTRTIEEQLEIVVRKCARAWLQTIVEGLPQWSGEAAGGFKFAQGTNGFLGRYLNVAIPIHPSHPRKDKDAESGGNQARYSFTSGQHKFTFYYRSDVIQWVLNDIFYSPTKLGIPRPWGLEEAAAEVYEQTLAQEIAKIPKISELGFDRDVQLILD